MRWYYLALLLALVLVALSPRLVDAECVPKVRDVPADSDAWRYAPTARGVGRDLGVPDDLIVRIVHVESRGDPTAISPAGARGLAQVMPFHFQPADRWWEPYVNLRAAAGLLRSLMDRFGDWLVATRWYGGWRGYEWNVFECQEAGE